MSTEPETPSQDDPPTPAVPPPAPEPPISFDAALYYTVDVTCATEGCINYAIVWPVTPVYSNAGKPNIVDGICDQLVRILDATLLDPQPIFD